MDWRGAGLAPTFPRPTVLALGILCFLATVSSTEALPLSYSSLPSLSSPTGLLLAIVSVAIALSLAVALGFAFKKAVKKVLKKLKRSKKGEEETKGEEERETYEQTREAWPEPFSDPEEEPVDVKPQFYEFLKEWNTHSFDERDEFIAAMIKEFPVPVTPSMAMDALQSMMQSQMNEPALNADTWFRMLHFIMMLKRHISDWDQTDQEDIPESDKIIPSYTHERFRAFLVGQAEEILRTHGDFAEKDEEGYKGFLRLIAFLLGFVCRDRRILKVMDETWDRFKFHQKDASRAVVWGYRRWKDDPIRRNYYNTYSQLIVLLKTMTSKERPPEGSKTQHLLFALGFGYEEDRGMGPLACLSQRLWSDAICEYKYSHFIGEDYLWLMRARDLAMGNAWQWMCEKGLSEHDRMCKRFGQDGFLYREVVDMVMKYPQDYLEDEGQWRTHGGSFMSHAARYSTTTVKRIVKRIYFHEHIYWYMRFQKYKKYIGHDIEAWLRKNDKHWEEMSKRSAVLSYDSE